MGSSIVFLQIFLIFAPLDGKMRNFKRNMAVVLMLIFCSYYAGISMFSHTHITNGSSIVHSHLGGGADHDHSDSQYAVIDILSNFQTEAASVFIGIESPFFQLSESFTGYIAPSFLGEVCPALDLRGPPQC